MDSFEENELKQMQKLEELRRVVQSILGSHVLDLVVLWILLLGGFLALFYFCARGSSTRYSARVALHYQPKSTVAVSSYDDKYVLNVLSREAVRHQLVENLNTTEGSEKVTGPKEIHIEQVFRQNNNFLVSLSAATEKDAVGFVNLLADLCIQAYVDERLTYLENWRRSLEQNRRELADKLEEVNTEMTQLNVTAVMVAPEKNYEYLQNRLTSEKANLAKQEASLRALEQQFKTLEESKADILPSLLPNITRIHEYQAELANLDQELRRLKEHFTARNPKVLAVASRRDQTEKEFHEFLAAKGLAVADMEFLESAPAVIKELNRVSEALNAARGVYDIQVKLVASLEADLQDFNAKFPIRQSLIRRQSELAASMEKLDSTITDINYLIPLVKNDLFIGEKASGAKEKLPFTKSTVSISLLGAFALTGLFAVIFLLLGYFYGEVHGEAEIEDLAEFKYLGILPTANSKFGLDLSERGFFSGISHQFDMLKPMPKVVLLGSLPGGELRPEFVQAFVEDCTVEERKVLCLEIVDAKKFKIPPDPGLHRSGLVVYSGDHGYLPVANPRCFSAGGEENKVRQSVKLLQKLFDLICIVQHVPLEEDDVFLKQVSMLCDGALLVVGVKKTPRRMVRHLQELQPKIGLTIMTVLSGRIKSY